MMHHRRGNGTSGSPWAGWRGKAPREKFQEISGVSAVEPVFPVVLPDDLSVLYITQIPLKMHRWVNLY